MHGPVCAILALPCIPPCIYMQLCVHSNGEGTAATDYARASRVCAAPCGGCRTLVASKRTASQSQDPCRFCLSPGVSLPPPLYCRYMAAVNNHVDVIQTLIDYGCNVDAYRDTGPCPPQSFCRGPGLPGCLTEVTPGATWRRRGALARRGCTQGECPGVICLSASLPHDSCA